MAEEELARTNESTGESSATEQEVEVEAEASQELCELYVSDDTDYETDPEAAEAEEEGEEEVAEELSTARCKELVAAMAARMLEEMRGRQGAAAGVLAGQNVRDAGVDKEEERFEGDTATEEKDVEDEEEDVKSAEEGEKDRRREELEKPWHHGWQRVVVCRGGRVTSTAYLTPPHPTTAVRARLYTVTKVMAHLAATGCRELLPTNFTVTRRRLHLRQDFEVCRSADQGEGGVASLVEEEVEGGVAKRPKVEGGVSKRPKLEGGEVEEQGKAQPLTRGAIQ